MFRFTIRDMLWLTVVVALVLSLWAVGTGRLRPLTQSRNPPRATDDHGHATPSKQAAETRDDATGSEAPAEMRDDWPRLVRQFVGHAGPVHHLRLSPNGQQLLSCSGGLKGDGTVRLWDVTTGKLAYTFRALSRQVAGIGFSPSGQQALCVSLGTVQIWDLGDGREVGRQWVGEGPLCLDVGPQPGLAALGLTSGDVAIWDYAAGIELRRFRGHTQPVRAVAFVSGGQRLVTAADDGTLRLWNVSSGEQLVGRSTPQLDTKAQEERIAQADRELKAARLAREEYLNGTFVQEEKRALSAIFVAEQNLVSAERGVQSAKRLVEKGIVTIKQVELAKVVAENAERQLDVWRKELETLRKYTKARVLQDCDNAIAAAEATLLEENNRLAQDRIELGEGCFARLPGPIRRLAVSAGGQLIAAAQDKSADPNSLDSDSREAPAVIVFDAQTGDMRQVLRGPVENVHCVAFAPDGNSLLAGGSEHVVYRWELDTAKLVREYQVPDAVNWDIVSGVSAQYFFTSGGGADGSQLQNSPRGDYPVRLWRLDEDGGS
jgi:WD40 repeat protein